MRRATIPVRRRGGKWCVSEEVLSSLPSECGPETRRMYRGNLVRSECVCAWRGHCGGGRGSRGVSGSVEGPVRGACSAEDASWVTALQKELFRREKEGRTGENETYVPFLRQIWATPVPPSPSLSPCPPAASPRTQSRLRWAEGASSPLPPVCSSPPLLNLRLVLLLLGDLREVVPAPVAPPGSCCTPSSLINRSDDKD
jgi:hypothetical protein